MGYVSVSACNSGPRDFVDFSTDRDVFANSPVLDAGVSPPFTDPPT